MERHSRGAHVALLSGLLFVLSACGGGRSASPPASGGGNPPPPPVTAPTAPTLTVSADIKQLVFTWSGGAGATSYKLFGNPDNASGFTQIGADYAANATTGRVNIAVHRQDWMNALYRLEACNSAGCTASSTVATLDAMVHSIGYFKASAPAAEYFFGVDVALSADGNTLAIGSSGEAGSGAGAGAEEGGNGAPNSGAVYIFARTATGWAQQEYIKASDTHTDDVFGYNVALSADGNTLAVAAPMEDSGSTGVDGDETDDGAIDSGAVYIYTRTGTRWDPRSTYIKARNAQANDDFGRAVSLSADGSTLVVGAPKEDGNRIGGENNNGADGAGAVYAFIRENGRWRQGAYIKASDADNVLASRRFGTSLSLNAQGTTLAIGAPEGDGGSAYIFARDGNEWSERYHLRGTNTENGDVFGQVVALSADGTTLAVGAPGEYSNATGVNGDADNDDAPSAGAVYVFASGTPWTQQAYLKASNTEAHDSFGFAVALSGDGNLLVATAVGENSNAVGIGGDQFNTSSDGAGAAYVFSRSQQQWSQRTYVKSSNPQSGDFFGFNVSMSDDGQTLVISAPGEDSDTAGVGGAQRNNRASNAGAAYLY